MDAGYNSIIILPSDVHDSFVMIRIRIDKICYKASTLRNISEAIPERHAKSNV